MMPRDPTDSLKKQPQMHGFVKRAKIRREMEEKVKENPVDFL